MGKQIILLKKKRPQIQSSLRKVALKNGNTWKINPKVKRKIKFENITQVNESTDNFKLAEDILIDELETSSENLHKVTFWVSDFKISDRDDVINSSGWMNDRLINFAQKILKSEHDVNGLHDTIFAPYYEETKKSWITNDYVEKQKAPSCQIH